MSSINYSLITTDVPPNIISDINVTLLNTGIILILAETYLALEIGAPNCSNHLQVHMQDHGV